MKKNIAYLEVLRPKQWYKNCLVFLPIIFSLNIFDFDIFLKSFLGFVVLCLAFGGSYIINDIIDYKKDLSHPEKRKRPLPSGRIIKNKAILFSSLLLIASMVFSYLLNPVFLIVISTMIILTLIYSTKVKEIFLVDVFFISVNFVLRAVCGVILIESSVSPWLIMGVFFVALLLSFGKRKNETLFLKDDSLKHRKVLAEYTPEFLNFAITITAATLIVAYSIYAMSGPPTINDWRLVLTIPVAFFIIIQYVALALKGGYQGKEFNDLLIKETKLPISIGIFLIMVLILLYFVPSKFFT